MGHPLWGLDLATCRLTCYGTEAVKLLEIAVNVQYCAADE